MRLLGLASVLVVLHGMGCGLAEAQPRGSRTIPVLVLCYDPVLRSQGGVRLSQYMKWQDARAMTTEVVRTLREVSGGYLNYRVAEYKVVDAFPVKRDGFRYDEKSFLEMWADRDKAHQPDTVSYAAIFREHGIVERVRKGEIAEVWLWGAPYFGWDEYAMKIPGDLIYYQTENPWFYRPYDIPDCGRTVWVMGWNYERGTAEALHSYGHRMEGILSLTVGRGVWDHDRNPDNIWNRFTRQADRFPNDAQVGNVHGGPNAKGGYDYAQKEAVLSQADDWLNYPRFKGERKLINCEAWGGPDYHLNFMKWWMSRIPKAPGATDGFYNNWWQYVANYDEAVRRMPPPGGVPAPARHCMR